MASLPTSRGVFPRPLPKPRPRDKRTGLRATSERVRRPPHGLQAIRQAVGSRWASGEHRRQAARQRQPFAARTRGERLFPKSPLPAAAGPRIAGSRRGGRVVEGAPLLREYTRDGIEGSNPFLSARYSPYGADIADFSCCTGMAPAITAHILNRTCSDVAYPHRSKMMILAVEQTRLPSPLRGAASPSSRIDLITRRSTPASRGARPRCTPTPP
jgi:hypothetical protein